MIILYIFLGLIAFILLFTAFAVFVPFTTHIDIKYWNEQPDVKLELFWIKYVIGARIRLKDLEKLQILIWFFCLPIPIKLSLKKEDTDGKKHSSERKEKQKENKQEETQVPKTESNNKSILQKLDDILKIKDQVLAFWRKYKEEIKKIYVRYITISLKYLELELGSDDPAQTGKVAGIVYSTLPFVPTNKIKIAWNYQKQTFNISAGIKSTMKFYGILCTLLHLYKCYKKDKKNEV
jgi:glutaredoxin